ncbi:MAG: GNAT family N-acetyltransferase [Candidatus Cryptobacteroides sp.]
MKKIIDPIDKGLLKSELTADRLLRTTNKAGNELYVVTGHDAPNVMLEIGRLREIAFRSGGGGTGESVDIDKFDTDPAYGYKQLVLWNPDDEEIIGGYRFALCDDIVYDRSGQPILTSSHMFHFTKHFIHKYLPYTIELGRSFVALEYQSSKPGPKGIFALDNLFDGIGALMLLYKGRMKYLFGKMTIYREYPEEARNMVMYFLKKHFGSNGYLVKPVKKVNIPSKSSYKKLCSAGSFKEDHKILNSEIRKMGVNIPPLVNSYMNLSPTMIYFGTGINDEFADVYDSGIMICFDEIYAEKKVRHIESLIKSGWQKLKKFKH